MSDTPSLDDQFDLEIMKVGSEYRCAYLNDFRIAGSKPYASEGPKLAKKWRVSLKDILRAFPFMTAWQNLHQLTMDRMGGKVQAWGVFARMDDTWVLQFPVYTTETRAQEAKSVFSSAIELCIAPLGIPAVDWIPHRASMLYPPIDQEVLWLDLNDEKPCHHLGRLKDDGLVHLSVYGASPDIAIRPDKFEAWMYTPEYQHGRV